MSKSKKSSKKRTDLKVNRKKKLKRRKTIILLTAAVVIIGVVIVIAAVNSAKSAKTANLCNTTWVPLSAKNASGDEVEMAEIYNVSYSTYNGSLNFNDDGSFTFWMTPGSPDDGTHSGVYELADDSTINMYFDDGTSTTFSVDYEGNTIISIELNYNDYTVTFTSSDNS